MREQAHWERPGTILTILITLCLFSVGDIVAEDAEPWFAFIDQKNELIGFKDGNGKIRIRPKFMGLTGAIRFRSIIAVMEEENDKVVSYYLLKNGRRVGIDKVFVDGDNYFDCESEGMIRFHDRASDRVGFFNGEGEMVIPPDYSTAEPFRNGLAWVIKGARKRCLGNHAGNTNCEHWRWEGGRQSLIDRQNRVIIENFEHRTDLDWYSLQITGEPSPNPLADSFKGINDRHYNFINMEKEFNDWLFHNFLPEPGAEKFALYSADVITYWDEERGWVAKKKGTFLKRNLGLMQSEFSLMSDPKTEYSIIPEELNGFQYGDEDRDLYFDDCGRSKVWQHPVFSVVISRHSERGDYQNHFDFLRGKNGYRLISVSIGND